MAKRNRDEDRKEEVGPTPGTAEGEPGGNDPRKVGPGPTPSKAEGDERPPVPGDFKHT